MIHVGDITKLNGAELPVVDVITGGSPCQDLSVAGKRAGLAGERSGLFMEQVRIVKEMREHDRSTGRTGYLTRPRYMLWENVPGAFSSNKGEDFRAVLEEIAKVEQEDAHIPRPEGSWPYAGCVMGDGWSIAWRLHDAQFWGVPQRRKRIALVADFGGQSAPEILFERKGMRRDTEESGEKREGTPTDVKGSVAATITSTYGTKWNGNAGAYNGENFVFERAISFQERAGKPGGGEGILIQDERIGALSTLNNQSVCCLNDQGGSQMGVTEDVTGTLRAQEHGHQPLVFEPGAASRVGGHVYEDDVAGTVRANAGDNQQAVCYGISSYESNAMKSANPHSGIYEAETARTLDNNGGSPACNQGGMVVLEGNGSRPSHKGDGYAESETMYTLNGTEHHAVAYRKTSHAKSAEDGQGWAETEVNDTLNAFDSGETRTPTVVVAPHITPKIDTNGVAFTLNERDYKDAQAVCIENHPQDSRVKISEDGVVQTLSKQMGTGGGNVPMVMEAIGGEVAGTLDASYYKGRGERQGIERDVVVQTYQDTTGTLSPGAHAGSYNGQDAYNDMLIAATVGALCARDHKGVGSQYVEEGKVVTTGSIVRRLTPLECERLQGFPDGWTDIGEWTDSKGKARKCSDSARYKALGNSIAIPFWFYILRRMAAQYERPATLGSLFDGIGGFPLCWERCNGKGTAIWASEIEEFAIAVTKKRFGE